MLPNPVNNSDLLLPNVYYVVGSSSHLVNPTGTLNGNMPIFADGEIKAHRDYSLRVRKLVNEPSGPRTQVCCHSLCSQPALYTS